MQVSSVSWSNTCSLSKPLTLDLLDIKVQAEPTTIGVTLRCVPDLPVEQLVAGHGLVHDPRDYLHISSFFMNAFGRLLDTNIT